MTAVACKEIKERLLPSLTTSIVVCKGKSYPLCSVGMIRLERTTPTSRTWCASQLRYIPRKNKLALGKFIDVNCNSALEIGCLVLVDQADLCELVYHCINLRSALLRCRLV